MVESQVGYASCESGEARLSDRVAVVLRQKVGERMEGARWRIFQNAPAKLERCIIVGIG